MYQIELHYVSNFQQLVFRDIYGIDELSILSNKSLDVIRLLDKLLVRPLQKEGGGDRIRLLPIAERDYILAIIYQRIYGAKIESTISCKNCQEAFDLDFLLPELVQHLWSNSQQSKEWYQKDGTFKTKEGLHFRLPTGEDEYAILNLPSETVKDVLIKKCIFEQPEKLSIQQIEEMMNKVAPLVETDLVATCPECDTSQEIFFSIQSYLLNALIQERTQLFNEIHLIAMTYKWSHTEILNLPRSIRKTYYRLIQHELNQA